MSLCHFSFKTLIITNGICSISRIKKELTISLLSHLMYNKSTMSLCFAAITLFSIALGEEMQISTRYDISKLLPYTKRCSIVIIKKFSFASDQRLSIDYFHFNCKEIIRFIFFHSYSSLISHLSCKYILN